MVRKLFKHEFFSYMPIMFIVYGVLLSFAIAGRILQFFENDSVIYTILSVASGITYGLSIIAAFGFSFVLGVIRFYKNLFTSEGYLSFTLPVTSSQHIIVKSVTAVCVNFITSLVVFISVCIISAGEMLTEIFKALAYIFEKLYDLAGVQTLFIGGELLILLLVGAFSGVLLYYTFICIGQLFKKNRVFAAVAAYFVFQIIVQVLSTATTILFSFFTTEEFWGRLFSWVTLHPYETIHIGMWSLIALSVIFVVVEFFVVRRIITRKLNLE